MIEQTIERWHRLVDAKDAEALNDILADNVVFHSPVVHTPQEGKAITKMYLTAALHTLNNEHFRYEREILDGRNAVLEFTTVLDGIQRTPASSKPPRSTASPSAPARASRRSGSALRSDSALRHSFRPDWNRSATPPASAR